MEGEHERRGMAPRTRRDVDEDLARLVAAGDGDDPVPGPKGALTAGAVTWRHGRPAPGAGSRGHDDEQEHGEKTGRNGGDTSGRREAHAGPR